MEEKKLSVIIPVYNSEKYLNRSIESLLNQTYKNIEIILVDDGSTDSSPEICDLFAEKEKNISVIHKENGGVSSARNAGFDVAQGEYIAFLDSDDYLSNKIYKTLIEDIETNNADIAISGFSREVGKNTFVPYCKDKFEKEFSREEMISNLLQNRYYSCSINNVVFRKDVVKDIKFDVKISYNEDLLYLFNIMKKCKTAYFTSEPLYFYCDNDGSASNAKFNKKMMTIIDVWDKIIDDIKTENEQLQGIAIQQYVRNNLMCAMLAVEGGYNDKKDFHRIQQNVRRNLKNYLSGSASRGYKFYAVVISISLTLFRFIKELH